MTRARREWPRRAISRRAWLECLQAHATRVEFNVRCSRRGTAGRKRRRRPRCDGDNRRRLAPRNATSHVRGERAVARPCAGCHRRRTAIRRTGCRRRTVQSETVACTKRHGWGAFLCKVGWPARRGCCRSARPSGRVRPAHAGACGGPDRRRGSLQHAAVCLSWVPPCPSRVVHGDKNRGTRLLRPSSFARRAQEQSRPPSCTAVPKSGQRQTTKWLRGARTRQAEHVTQREHVWRSRQRRHGPHAKRGTGDCPLQGNRQHTPPAARPALGGRGAAVVGRAGRGPGAVGTRRSIGPLLQRR